MNSITPKIKSRYRKSGDNPSPDIRPPKIFSNPTDCGHSERAVQVLKRKLADYEDSSGANQMSVTPRQPLHRKATSSPNERLILCKRCGSLSADISNNCCRAGRESKFALSPSISIGPAANRKLSKGAVQTGAVNSPQNPSPSSSQAKEEFNEAQRLKNKESDDSKIATKVSQKQNELKQPVVLVLSSDDEAAEVSVAPRLKKAAQRELAKAINPSFPAPRKELPWSPAKDELKIDLQQLTHVDINSIYEPYMCIKCKNVHIGSYRTDPIERILFMRTGVRFSVTHPTSSQEPVTIALPTKYLLRIFWYTGPDVSFLVFYVKEKLAQHIRNLLGMHTESEVYFDPCSEADNEKKLIIFPRELTDDILSMLNSFYNGQSEQNLFQQLKQDVKSFLASITNEGQSKASGRMSPTDPNIICHFSPKGLKGSITLTLDDFLCLEEGEFINDVIIDFYLRYLIFKLFKPSVATRTHLFSTYFYKRLTSCNDSRDTLTPRERRHNRVQNWTKGVDIFEKDFIIIPINTQWHWFLAIICFPNLNHPQRMSDGDRVPWKPVCRRKKQKILENGNMSKEESDRDESDSESNAYDDSEDDYDDNSDEAIKQPCIIIFDSFQGSASRTKVVTTLRSYLHMEHLRRKGHEKIFNSVTMRGLYPPVPQQPNFYDCGVYTLQYAESFFTEPVCDYSQSLQLSHWFGKEEVTCKREEIIQLIKDLRKEQFPNTSFDFPMLTTRSELEEYGLVPESDYRGQSSTKSLEPTSHQQSAPQAEPHRKQLSWLTDSVFSSLSKLKRHFSPEKSGENPENKNKKISNAARTT